MRVGIIALLQESNTFLAKPTTLAHFEHELLVTGEAVRERMGDSHHEVGGFFTGLAEAKLDAVPIFAARALPYGRVTAGAFDALLTRMLDAVDLAGKLDGILVAPHGATVSERVDDVDGCWLTELRAHVGAGMPIIGTLDLHANLSPQMVAACDALIAYRQNPHLDQKARGIDAARLMARTLRGEVRPTMAAGFPPLIANIERQHTAEEPCRSLYALADRMLTQPGVLSNSVILGFPYADVPEMGSSVIVVTDNDRPRAQQLANELAAAWWARREEFAGQLISVADAVQRAAKLPGPVCLLDMGDNVGGGSPGDGTLIAHELLRQQVGPSFVCLADAESVQKASAAGIGGTVRLRMGGKADRLHGGPIEAECNVLGMYDGRFEEPEPRHGSIKAFDQGQTALVRSGPLTIMLTTRRMVPFSLRQLTTFGIEPARFQVLVAKGVNAPVAAYAPVCPHLIRVNTPGVTTADMSQLTFHRRRRPMFPFERAMKWP